MVDGLTRVRATWVWHSSVFLHKEVHAEPRAIQAPLISRNDFEKILFSFKNKAIRQGFKLKDKDGRFGWILEVPEMFPELSVDLSSVAFGFDEYTVMPEIQTDYRLVPYLECYSFNAGEFPVMFYIFFDGKALRGFIPISGNALNAKEGRALRMDEDGLCDEDTLYVFRDAFPKAAEKCTELEIIEGSRGVDFDKVFHVQREWANKDFCGSVLKVRPHFDMAQFV